MPSNPVRMLLFVLVIAATITLDAGGWAVISLRDVPTHVAAGTPLTIDYAVRQHGVTVRSDLDGHVEAECGARTVTAKSSWLEEPGHYRATLILPQPGPCTLVVASGFNGRRSPPIQVQALRAGEAPSKVAEADLGRRLFDAKGCVTCHAHPASSGESMRVGPDLPIARLSPDRIAQVLAPRGTGTVPALADEAYGSMPDLKLRSREVQALTAFLMQTR